MSWRLTSEENPVRIGMSHINMLHFHESWDWLIPVCRKFKDLDLPSSKYHQYVEAIDSSIIDEYDINQAFETVVAAIEWFTNQLSDD